jgi:hypothetical protein
MRPPDGPSPLDNKLWRLAGEEFPSGWQEFGYWYLKHTALVIKTIESEAAEANTDAIVQKFADDLRRNNLRQFAPFSIYLGGRYSFLLASCLQGMVDIGVLRRRASNHQEINQRVYEIDPKYQDSLNHPDVWTDIFTDFRNSIDLINPFKDHFNKRTLKWISNEDAYLWVTPNAESRDIDQLELSDKKGHEDVAGIRNQIQEFDQPAAEAGTLLYELLREYKLTDQRKQRHKDAGKVVESRIRFSNRYLQEYHDKPDVDVRGKVIFTVGFFDIGEEIWQNPQPDVGYLREHIASPHSIGIKLPEELTDATRNLHEIALGVLATVDERDGEPILDPIAILKSNDLPDEIVNHQHEKRAERRTKLAEERSEIFSELEKYAGHQEPELSEEDVRKQVEDVLESAELDDDERKVFRWLLELIAIAAAQQGLDWVLVQIIEAYPKYAPQILDAIGLSTMHTSF